MSLFGYMRIHESRIDRNLGASNTSSTPAMPTPALNPPPCTSTANSSITPSASSAPTKFSSTHAPSSSPPTTTSPAITILVADTDTIDFSCPHYPTHSPRALAW
ncbi:hypothetical protein SprV_0802515600 [Sparganum proliferum]